MGTYFHRFLVVLLLTFVGLGIWSSGEVYALGSINVPQVNDHFDKFDKSPAPKQEQPIKQNVKEEKGTWDWLTKPVSGAWNWTVDKVSSAWKKTKEFFSKHDWLAGVLAIITTIVIVNISFNKGVWDAVVDTVKGIWNIIRHPIDTLKNTLYSIMHPIETVKAIWKTISDSWKRDVVNGNASSRARWFGYAIGQVVLSIVGTKGVDKVAKISKVAAISRVAKVSKVTGISKGLNIVQKGMKKFHISETVTKIRNGSLKLGQFLSKNKVAASIFTVLGVFGGFLWHESDAIANAVNKITVAAEKYEIKSVFKNAEKCFGYQPTPKYFASVNEPFFKCFYAPDGRGGGGKNSTANNGNQVRLPNGYIHSSHSEYPNYSQLPQRTFTVIDGTNNKGEPIKIARFANGVEIEIYGSKYAGTTNPKGIPFDHEGFPEFTNWVKTEVYLPEDKLVGSSSSQLRAATRALRDLINADPHFRDLLNFSDEQLKAIEAGSPKIPGFTWHHHQDTGRMQLVPTQQHRDAVPHTGGHRLWGQGQ